MVEATIITQFSRRFFAVVVIEGLYRRSVVKVCSKGRQQKPVALICHIDLVVSVWYYSLVLQSETTVSSYGLGVSVSHRPRM